MKFTKKTAEKTSGNKLSHIKKEPFSHDHINTDNEVLLHKQVNEFKFDFLWSPKQGADKIFILFSGDALREKNAPPVFQRWTWAPNFPGHCLYISDPSLYLDNSLGLAWYAGTANFDPMQHITTTISDLAQHLSIKKSNIYAYGSSGGGFAALRLLTFMDEICAIAINPQTCITNYHNTGVRKFLSTCFPGRSKEEALQQFNERINLITHAPSLAKRRIIYAQNELDEHHMNNHFTPFREAILKESSTLKKFIEIIFFHEDGHKKAETKEVFEQIMKIISTGY